MKKYFIAAAILVAGTLNMRADLDTAKIDQITGLKGKMNQAEGVYKVTFPRDDVKVSVAGWQMPPFMGLGTWAAFQGTNDRSEEHTSELQSQSNLVCRLLLEKKKN